MKRSTDGERERPNRVLGNPLDLPRPHLTGCVQWELLPETMRRQLTRNPPAHYSHDPQSKYSFYGSMPSGNVYNPSVFDRRQEWIAVSHLHPEAFLRFQLDPGVVEAVSGLALEEFKFEHERALREVFGAAMIGRYLPLPPLYGSDASAAIEERLTEIVRAYKSQRATQTPSMATQ